MKSIISIYKLKMSIVLKSTVLVVPTVMTVIFLGIMYSVQPQQITGSFLLSGFFLFVISVFLSMLIQLKENDVQEEMLLLHSNSELGYYMAREMVLVGISFVYAIIVIAYPVIRSCLNPGFFTRPLKVEDVIYGGLIVVGSGLCGIAVGDLFHHRIFGHARYTVIGVIFVSLLAFCKYGLIDNFSFLKVLHIIMPPITDGLKMVGNTDIFDWAGSLKIFAHMLIFSAAAVVIKIRLLKYLKFR